MYLVRLDDKKIEEVYRFHEDLCFSLKALKGFTENREELSKLKRASAYVYELKTLFQYYLEIVDHYIATEKSIFRILDTLGLRESLSYLMNVNSSKNIDKIQALNVKQGLN